MDQIEHRGEPGEYTPSCPCVACEKHRAKEGMTMINPRGMLDGPTESRPTAVAEGMEIR